MKGYKNSTKTQYTQGGGDCGPKGAAKSASVMAKFKNGGAVSSRPVDSKGRRISTEELSTPARILSKSGRADSYERMPTTSPDAAPRRPLGRGAARDIPTPRTGLKCGGLAVMPKGRNK